MPSSVHGNMIIWLFVGNFQAQSGDQLSYFSRSCLLLFDFTMTIFHSHSINILSTRADSFWAANTSWPWHIFILHLHFKQHCIFAKVLVCPRWLIREKIIHFYVFYLWNRARERWWWMHAGKWDFFLYCPKKLTATQIQCVHRCCKPRHNYSVLKPQSLFTLELRWVFEMLKAFLCQNKSIKLKHACMHVLRVL